MKMKMNKKTKAETRARVESAPFKWGRENREELLFRTSTKLRQKLELLLMRDDFKKVLSAFRKKWGIPPKGFQGMESEPLWRKALHKSQKGLSYRNELEGFLETFGVAKRWKPSVEYYVLFKTLKGITRFLPQEVEAEIRYNPLTKDEEIILVVQPTTTREDISDCWHIIQNYQGIRSAHLDYAMKKGKGRVTSELLEEFAKDNVDVMPYIKKIIKQKYKKWQIFKQRKYVYQLYKQGVTYEEIGRKMKEKGLSDVILNYTKIKNILQDLRRQIKENRMY